MVEVISRRKKRELRNSYQTALKVAEAQVSALGQIMAGLAQSKKASASMVKAARSIDFTLSNEKKKKELPSTAHVESMMGVRAGGHIGVR